MKKITYISREQLVLDHVKKSTMSATQMSHIHYYLNFFSSFVHFGEYVKAQD